jgi:type VI secretion system secreted protein Hcp
VADVDYFLEIDEIPGESLDDQFKGKIEILSFTWGVTNEGTSGRGGGAGAGRAAKTDLNVETTMSTASPKFAQAAASGLHLPKVLLHLRKASGDAPFEYATFELDDAYISGYQVGGHGAGIVPHETISINFSSLSVTYNQQSETGAGSGPATLGWDFAASKKV